MYISFYPTVESSFNNAAQKIEFLQSATFNQLVEDDKSTTSHHYILSASKTDQKYYWNNYKLPKPNPNQQLLTRKGGKNNSKWSFSAEIINKNGNLSSWLFSNYYNEFEFAKSNSPTEYEIKIQDTLYYFSPSERKIHRSKYKAIFVGLLCIGFMGVILLFFGKSRLNKLTIKQLTTQVTFLLVIRLFIFAICRNTWLKHLQVLSQDNYFNFFTPSIGDLLFNTLLAIACVILLSRTNSASIKQSFKTRIYAVFSITVVYLLYLYIASLSQSAVFLSGIKLNAEEVLNFDVYSFAFIGILIIHLFLLFILHYMSILWMSMSKLSKHQRTITYMISFCIIVFITSFVFNFSFALVFSIFLTALSLLLDIFWGVSRKSIVWIIWWILIYSAFLAIVLFTFGIQKRVVDRQQYLQSVYKKTDNNMLESIKSIIDNDKIKEAVEVLTKTSLPSQFDKKDLSEYLTEFEPVKALQQGWTVKLFDPNGTNMLKYEYQNKSSFITSFKYLKLVEDHIYFDHLSGTYIGVLQGKTNETSSQKALNLNIVVSSPKASYDELNTNYSIYQNGIHITGKDDNERQNATFCSLPAGEHYFKNKSVIVEQPIEQEDVKIISSETVANLIKPISLFSYLFCLIGIFLVIIIIALRSVPHDKSIFNIEFEIVPLKSLRTRLQLSVVALVIFSFLVIGVVTVFFFSNNIHKTKKTEELNKVKLLLKDIDSRLSQAIDNESAKSIFVNNVFDLKAVHNSDFNLYKKTGELIVSTLSDVTQYRYPYEFYSQFSKINEQHTIVTEDSQNNSLFIPLNPIGQGDIGILEIKTLDKISNRFQITDFISTILNVYVFLFLLAGAIAISIANSITRPLSQLSENLKRTRIGKKNEALEWNSNDEVGELIRTYNQMINELDASAQMLAQTERDLAWREMAKQVAHEIKNPLTPMKLSIQYLERAIEADPENATKLIEKVSTTLVEQIDNLSQIATEFSNFGTMPQANNEKIVLNEIVEAVHDLFRKREDMDIKLIEPINDIYVYADRNHLVRILNNLLKNSIQAIPDERRGLILMELTSKNGNALIKVTDNGKGIPDHMKSKVFTPNFTTKSSGTGLGLAICANMIESFNGKIYFDSEVNKGTSFYIEVPLMRLDDNRDTTNRVFLD